MLNESKGNMYPFVTHTWNPIKGECPHACSYCYMKKWGTKLKPLRLVESELKTEFPVGGFIFVGSSTDMWLAPDEMIAPVLEKCIDNAPTRYLFQTKDPEKFIPWMHSLNSMDTLLAVTIESNRCWNGSTAPSTAQRYIEFKRLNAKHKMVSIEPVMDFDADGLLYMVENIHPDFVSIGANTNPKVKLPEPSPEKLRDFIEKLSTITQVVQKNNLRRLIE